MRTVLASSAGLVLREAFRLLLRLRHPRPIHARGRVLTGEITFVRGATRSGVEWIDDPPVDTLPVTARLSRGIGLPSALPDIIGLALRVESGAHDSDIEFASTGFGVPSRFMLFPRRSPSRARYGTLLPYQTAGGPLLLGAATTEGASLPAGGAALDRALADKPWRMKLFHATLTGKWHAFADLTLQLAEPAGGQPALRFDAAKNQLPGTTTYQWVHALREPSYTMVQDR